jgi:glutamyl-tRNA synthetase
MRNLKRGEIIKLERKGYYSCGAWFMRPSKLVVLFATPDGRKQALLNQAA